MQFIGEMTVYIFFLFLSLGGMYIGRCSIVKRKILIGKNKYWCGYSTLFLGLPALFFGIMIFIVTLKNIIQLLFSDISAPFATMVPLLFIGVPVALIIEILRNRKKEFGQEKLFSSEVNDEIKQAKNYQSDIVAPASEVTMSKTNGNYFIRHWRGELSLPISYWLNGCVLSGIMSYIIATIVGLIVNDNYSLREVSLVNIFVLFAIIAIIIWAIVGIWRSVDRYATNSKQSSWRSFIHWLVIFSTIISVCRAIVLLPQVMELGLIVIGKDPIGETNIQVSSNGQSVKVTGMLREGSASEIQRILEAAPGATFLVLNSNGGRLYEARKLANYVRGRNLDTYVEEHCESACTYVFLAGKDRAATPNAKIGFHQPSFVGLDSYDKWAITQEMLDYYRLIGLPENFIQHIGKTPADKMWYPTRDELIANNVITRISFGGEAANSYAALKSKEELYLMLKSISLYKAYEKRLPGLIDKIVERAWAVKQQGGTDSDITNAIRSITSSAIPVLLKTANDHVLNNYVNLMINEMVAARSLNAAACEKLFLAKLDITQTLPDEIIKQDQNFVIELLTTSPRDDKLLSVDKRQFEHALELVLINMPTEHIKVIADTSAYTDQPELFCDATISFFKNVKKLPDLQRNIAMRGMFQNDN